MYSKLYYSQSSGNKIKCNIKLILAQLRSSTLHPRILFRCVCTRAYINNKTKENETHKHFYYIFFSLFLILCVQSLWSFPNASVHAVVFQCTYTSTLTLIRIASNDKNVHFDWLVHPPHSPITIVCAAITSSFYFVHFKIACNFVR